MVGIDGTNDTTDNMDRDMGDGGMDGTDDGMDGRDDGMHGTVGDGGMHGTEGVGSSTSM